MNQDDKLGNIIQIRKDCEKLTCVPYPKDPDQSDKI